MAPRYVVNLTAEIADRLRPSCAHLSDSERQALASDIAVFTLKYLGRVSFSSAERESAVVNDIAGHLLPSAAWNVIFHRRP